MPESARAGQPSPKRGFSRPHDLRSDLRLHRRAVAEDLRGDRVAAGPDGTGARDRPRDRPRAGAGGGVPAALARSPHNREPRAAGPLRRPQHRRRRVRRRGRRLPRRRRGGGPGLAGAPRPGLPRPRRARGRRRHPPSLGGGQAVLVPAGVRLGRRLHPLRDAAGAGDRPQPGRRQHVLSPRHPRRGRRLPPRAGADRDDPLRLRGDRSLHPHRPALAGRADPLRPAGHGRPLRAGGTGRTELLHLTLPRRGALEGGSRRPGRQRVGARSRALLRSPDPAPRLPARPR